MIQYGLGVFLLAFTCSAQVVTNNLRVVDGQLYDITKSVKWSNIVGRAGPTSIAKSGKLLCHPPTGDLTNNDGRFYLINYPTGLVTGASFEVRAMMVKPRRMTPNPTRYDPDATRLAYAEYDCGKPYVATNNNQTSSSW